MMRPKHTSVPCGVRTKKIFPRFFPAEFLLLTLLPSGTMRRLLGNYVLGVSEGHICILQLVGVGFRASIEPTATTAPPPEYPGQQYVSLKVGYAHPIEMGVP